jgi:hypothetical protein
MSTDNQNQDRRHWPKDVRPLTFDEGDRLGVRDADNALFWDGKELQTRQVVSLRKYEAVLAFFATAATVGMFVLELGRTFGYWGE